MNPGISDLRKVKSCLLIFWLLKLENGQSKVSAMI